MLNADLESNACGFSRLAQGCDHGDPLTRVPPERLFFRDRMHDGQFCDMRTAENESVVECGAGALREIDHRKNARESVHVWLLQLTGAVRISSCITTEIRGKNSTRYAISM